jgi:autotransporter-associated beta strand protein
MLFLCPRITFGTAAAGGGTWDGGAGGATVAWSAANNWADNNVPLSSSPTNIVMQGTAKTTNYMDLAGLAIRSLTINNSAAQFVIRGNTLTNGIGGINNLHTQSVIISNNWALSAPQTWSSSAGTLDIVGNVANMGNTLIWDNSSVAGVTNIIQGIISGTGGLTITGTGTNILAGVNTYTGATTINGGVLTLASSGGIGNASPVIVNSPGVLDLSVSGGETIGSLAGSGNVSLGSAWLFAGMDNTSTTYSGVISGTGTFVKDGTGTNVLSGANTYTGATTINGGMLTVGAAGAIPNSSAVTVTSPGVLNLGSASETVGSLAGSGNVVGTGWLSAGGDNSSTAYSGVISAGLGLTCIFHKFSCDAISHSFFGCDHCKSVRITVSLPPHTLGASQCTYNALHRGIF